VTPVISQEHRVLKSVEVHAQKFESGGEGLGLDVPYNCADLKDYIRVIAMRTNGTTSRTILYKIQQQMRKKHIPWQDQ